MWRCGAGRSELFPQTYIQKITHLHYNSGVTLCDLQRVLCNPIPLIYCVCMNVGDSWRKFGGHQHRRLVTSTLKMAIQP